TRAARGGRRQPPRRVGEVVRSRPWSYSHRSPRTRTLHRRQRGTRRRLEPSLPVTTCFLCFQWVAAPVQPEVIRPIAEPPQLAWACVTDLPGRPRRVRSRSSSFILTFVAQCPITRGAPFAQLNAMEITAGRPSPVRGLAL